MQTNNLKKEALEYHARDRRVLNTFAYTGSLGVAAAAVGGARSVVHVDIKRNPLAKLDRGKIAFIGAIGRFSP